MQIIRDDKQGLFTLIPSDAAERAMLNYAAIKLNPNDKITYNGQVSASDDCRNNLRFQIASIPMSITSGNFTYTCYQGGMEFILKGDLEDDKGQISYLRDMCYFGKTGLTFLNIVELDGEQVIVITGKYCSQCNQTMITPRECNTKVCDGCADMCDHIFDNEGLLLGGESHFSAGVGCSKCCRAKPLPEGGREKSIVEKHLDVEKKLGITVIYKDGPPSTPKELVKAERIIRNYTKATQKQKQ